MTANPAIVDAVNRIFTQVQTIITKRMSQAGIHQSSISADHLRGTPPSTVIKSITSAPSSVFGASGVGHAQGVVPDPGAVAGITRFLREDATWDVPSGGGGGGAAAAINGRVLLITPPDVSAWTWFNQGSATADNNQSILTIGKAGANGDSISGLSRPAPTPPYSIVAAISATYFQVNFPQFGIGWYDGTKLALAWFQPSNTAGPLDLNAAKWNSVTSFSANYISQNISTLVASSQVIWVKITDDGTNRTISLSADGNHWSLYHSVGRTDFLTPTSVVFAMNPNLLTASTAMVYAHLWSWTGDGAIPGGGVGGAIYEITVGFDGEGSVIAAGKTQDVYLDFGGTITSWTLLADQAGSCDISIWKAPYSSFPPVAGGSITGGADPSLSSQTKNQSSSLTGWTTTFAAGDVLRFKVASVSVCTRLSLELTFTRS